MKKILLVLFLVFTTKTFAQPELPKDKIKVEVHHIKGYGESEKFALESIEKLEKLLNSEEFKEEFLKLKMTQREGFDNSELLNLIIAGKENRGSGSADNTMDVRLRVMSMEEDGSRWMKNCKIGSRAGTIGKEADNSGYTITCPERIKIWDKNNSYGCLAGHIMHEYLHNLGFKHKWYSKRKSFVYKTGNLVQHLIQGNNNSCPTNL